MTMKPNIEQMKLHIYKRHLHPELFEIFIDKRIDTGKYQAHLAILGLGHLICFHAKNESFSELMTGDDKLLPKAGWAQTIELRTSRESRTSVEQNIHCMLNVQSEKMSKHVFEHVHNEMMKFARNRGIFIAFDQWAKNERLAPFSFIDYEAKETELEVFAYHAFPETQTFIRTQSVFATEHIVLKTNHD